MYDLLELGIAEGYADAWADPSLVHGTDEPEGYDPIAAQVERTGELPG